MKRPPMIITWREPVFALLVLLIVVAGLIVTFEGRTEAGLAGESPALHETGAKEPTQPAEPKVEKRGKPRDADIGEIRRRIDMGKLSDHPAMHSKPVDPNER